jgi:hypothetical protein
MVVALVTEEPPPQQPIPGMNDDGDDIDEEGKAESKL